MKVFGFLPQKEWAQPRTSGIASLPDCFLFGSLRDGGGTMGVVPPYPCLRDIVPQTPFLASRGFMPVYISTLPTPTLFPLALSKSTSRLPVIDRRTGVSTG